MKKIPLLLITITLLIVAIIVIFVTRGVNIQDREVLMRYRETINQIKDDYPFDKNNIISSAQKPIGEVEIFNWLEVEGECLALGGDRYECYADPIKHLFTSHDFSHEVDLDEATKLVVTREVYESGECFEYDYGDGFYDVDACVGDPRYVMSLVDKATGTKITEVPPNPHGENLLPALFYLNRSNIIAKFNCFSGECGIVSSVFDRGEWIDATDFAKQVLPGSLESLYFQELFKDRYDVQETPYFDAAFVDDKTILITEDLADYGGGSFLEHDERDAVRYVHGGLYRFLIDIDTMELSNSYAQKFKRIPQDPDIFISIKDAFVEGLKVD